MDYLARKNKVLEAVQFVIDRSNMDPHSCAELLDTPLVQLSNRSVMQEMEQENWPSVYLALANVQPLTDTVH